MNWSTRLRRWVRIRTPPVREASMKPTAATVLPEPVACSNQKRRLAPGSSGASSTTSSSSCPAQSSASSASVASSSSSASTSPSSPSPEGFRSVLGSHLDGGGRVPVPRPGVAVDPLLHVGDQRGERSGQRVDLMGIELRPVGELRLLLRQHPLEPEHQREVPPPLDRGRLEPLLYLRKGGIQRAAPGSALRQVRGLLALEQEGLSRELAGSLDVSARRRLCRLLGGRLGRFSHLRLSDPARPAARTERRGALA